MSTRGVESELASSAMRAAGSVGRIGARAVKALAKYLVRSLIAAVGPAIAVAIIAGLVLAIVVGSLFQGLYGGAQQGYVVGDRPSVENQQLLAEYKAAAATTIPKNAPSDYRQQWAVPWETLAAIDRAGLGSATQMAADGPKMAQILTPVLTYRTFSVPGTTTVTTSSTDGKVTTVTSTTPGSSVSEVVGADTWDGTYALTYSVQWSTSRAEHQTPSGSVTTVARSASLERTGVQYTQDFSRLKQAMQVAHVAPSDLTVVLSLSASFAGASVDWATTTPYYYAAVVPIPAPGPDTQANVLRWAPEIKQVATQDGLDPALIAGVITIESGGNPAAVSPADCLGLMQASPGKFDAGQNPFDPLTNIQVGSRYLQAMLEEFHGNVQLALAAYNAGPGAVLEYGGIPPYPETLQYVPNVMAAMQLYEDNSQL